MAEQTEVIRQEMEETRSHLAEKLEMLENQVANKVEQTATSVSETVENVTDTVQETVEAVKNTFDVQWHAEHHPWLLVGGAVVAGFVGGRLLLPPPRRRRREDTIDVRPARAASPAPPSRDDRDGHGREGPSPFGQTAHYLKEMGIGTVMSVLREMAVRALPAAVTPLLTGAVNAMTERMGGRPLGAEPSTSQVHPGQQGRCEMMP